MRPAAAHSSRNPRRRPELAKDRPELFVGLFVRLMPKQLNVKGDGLTLFTLTDLNCANWAP